MMFTRAAYLIAIAIPAVTVRSAYAVDPEGGGVRGIRNLNNGNGNGIGNGKGITKANGGKKVEGSYIVRFDASVSKNELTGKAKAALAKTGGALRAKGGVSKLINGFLAEMTEAEALLLANEDHIESVEEDAEAHTEVTWGLDRVDQADLPLDNVFNPGFADQGSGAVVYVIDTGIRKSHNEFGGRAETSSAYDFVNDGQNGNDCNGHGTHCAGTVGGANYGVAPQTNLVGVRVLGCNGSGTYAGVIAGMEKVLADCPAGISTSGPFLNKRCVASMSLGGGASLSVNTAVDNMKAAGIVVAVAAGNSNANACSYSPAGAAGALTVGSTTSSDDRSDFSNYGSCVNIFAPGSSITSAWSDTDSQLKIISGTSMATPHVAGAVALLVGNNPDLTAEEAEAQLAIMGTLNKVNDAGSGSTNLLLNANINTLPTTTSTTMATGATTTQQATTTQEATTTGATTTQEATTTTAAPNTCDATLDRRPCRRAGCRWNRKLGCF